MIQLPDTAADCNGPDDQPMIDAAVAKGNRIYPAVSSAGAAPGLIRIRHCGFLA
jgi:hypothetical protein